MSTSLLLFRNKVLIYSLLFTKKLGRHITNLIIPLLPDLLPQHMKGLEAKGPFWYLGLNVRFKMAYDIPINY